MQISYANYKLWLKIIQKSLFSLLDIHTKNKWEQNSDDVSNEKQRVSNARERESEWMSDIKKDAEWKRNFN